MSKSSFEMTAIIEPIYRLKGTRSNPARAPEKAAAKLERELIKKLQSQWKRDRLPSKIANNFCKEANSAENAYLRPHTARYWGFSTACWTARVWQDHVNNNSKDTMIIHMSLKNTQKPYNYQLVVHTKRLGSRIYHGVIGNMAAVRLSKTRLKKFPKHPHHVTALPGASNYEKAWVKENYDGKIPKKIIVTSSPMDYVLVPSVMGYQEVGYLRTIKSFARDSLVDMIDQSLRYNVSFYR